MGSESELLWGCTVWFGWYWFFFSMEKIADNCKAFMWSGVDGVALFYA